VAIRLEQRSPAGVDGIRLAAESFRDFVEVAKRAAELEEVAKHAAMIALLPTKAATRGHHHRWGGTQDAPAIAAMASDPPAGAPGRCRRFHNRYIGA
jgi:hypothetical protein